MIGSTSERVATHLARLCPPPSLSKIKSSSYAAETRKTSHHLSPPSQSAIANPCRIIACRIIACQCFLEIIPKNSASKSSLNRPLGPGREIPPNHGQPQASELKQLCASTILDHPGTSKPRFSAASMTPMPLHYPSTPKNVAFRALGMVMNPVPPLMFSETEATPDALTR